MKSIARNIAMILIAFAVTLGVRLSLQSRASQVNAAPPSTSKPSHGAPGWAGVHDEPGTRTGPRVVDKAERLLTPFERALEQQPTQATALRNAVFMATARARHERGAELEQCATSDEAPGPQRLRFRIRVSATEGQFETQTWRFVEVVDGTALGPDIVSCMEEMLGGPYSGERPDYTAFLPGFDGDIDLVYRLQAFE